MQDAEAYIRSAVDHYISPARMVIESLVYAFDLQRKPVAAVIRAAGDIKSKTTLAGLVAVGEGEADADCVYVG